MRLCLLVACSAVLPLLTATPNAMAQRKPNPAFERVDDVAGLPRVLLIGDSISIGYTVPVRAQLQGIANVHRIPTNGGPTTRGLESLDSWLGAEKWDVIHFNWGLHDLKFIDDKNALVPPDQGHQQVPITEYEENLEQLVVKLKATGATLIWCSTTPVPEGAAGRIPGAEGDYNAAALRVMQRHTVVVNDLCAFAAKHAEPIQQPANVHFTPAGSTELATQVSRAIREHLSQR